MGLKDTAPLISSTFRNTENDKKAQKPALKMA